MIPKYIPKKYRLRIENWDDERSIGNALIISLHDGWRWNHGDVDHVAGFDTVAAVLVALRITTHCNCKTCQEAKKAKTGLDQIQK